MSPPTSLPLGADGREKVPAANLTIRADAALTDEIRVSLPYPRAGTDLERRALAPTVAVSKDAAPAADKV